MTFKSSPRGITIQYDKYIHLVDYYLCNILHNPIYSSTIIISFTYYQLVQNSSTTTTTAKEDYAYDLVSNIINLIFICRFQFKFAHNHKLVPPLAKLVSEVVFLLIQIASCCYLMTTLYPVYPSSIQIFIILQILLPFVIFVTSMWHHAAQEWTRALSECNNNLLPFFISNSFLFINYYDDGLGSIGLMGLCFKLACFSFKFYLIYQFVVYELISINYCDSGMEIVDNCQFYLQRPNLGSAPTSEVQLDEDLEKKMTAEGETDEQMSMMTTMAQVKRWMRYTSFKNWLMVFVSCAMIGVDVYKMI
ncbi:uncharacterized protein LODBEIA_P59820 [Lodderomyces beijingensis]|uniref:Transmembrane protein n=1 Tax=Lodderomyces beijingensis TaxID=1775926 RepID=A0ABP0ZUE5_9ASCO